MNDLRAQLKALREDIDDETLRWYHDRLTAILAPEPKRKPIGEELVPIRRTKKRGARTGA